MRKENPTRYSSAVGEAWMHCEFKIKYCHPLFDNASYREHMLALLREAAQRYEIPLGIIGFDSDHVHFLVDIGLYDRPTVAKLLRGYTGHYFFKQFPELKRQKHEGGKFWGSGLWNPSYYIGSPHNLASTIAYIQQQKYGSRGKRVTGQTTLLAF